MIRRTFEWRTDEEHGDDGWILQGQPTFNATSGYGIAHDVLEHFASKNDANSLTEELLAFGAILRVRGESGWFSARHYGQDYAAAAGSGLAHLYEQVICGELLAQPVRPTRPLRYGVDDDLQRGVDEMLRVVNYELDKDSTPYIRDEITERFIGWMRIGYRKAVRRYPGSDGCDLAWAFDKISGEADRRFRHGEYGDKLRVLVDPRTLEYRMYREEANA